MKTTERFEKAISVLYKAFHEGTLDAMNCRHCAVGNLLGHSHWSPSLNVQELILVGSNNSMYSLKELADIEKMFLHGNLDVHNKHIFSNTIPSYAVTNGFRTKEEQRELQFKGLCAVVEYLAQLDNIPNPMDYSRVFERKNNIAKYQLEEVF